MPQVVTKTYGRRSNSSAALKRKTTSEPSSEDDDVPEKRRRVSPAPSTGKPDFAKVDSGKAATTKSIPDARKPPATPTKLTKRMLGRSRTETSVVPDSDTVLPVRRTPSLPMIPSSPSSPSKPTRPSYGTNITSTAVNGVSLKGSSTTGSTSLSFSAASTASRTTAVKTTRTYAGGSRSFLVPLSGANPFDVTGNSNNNLSETGGEEELDDEFSRESYASLRQRWGVDASEDDPWDDPRQGQSGSQTPTSAPSSPSKTKVKGAATPTKGRTRSYGMPTRTKSQTLPIPEPLPSNMMNPLKSITELRNKGESRRFMDEVAYLLDGMKPPKSGQSNIGLVRASAQELVTKLVDSDFARKARAADIYGKVYDLLLEAGAGTGTDKVLDTILLAFLVLLARDAAALLEIGEMHPPSLTSDAVPGSRGSKGKAKAGSSSSRSLVDTLFILVHCYASDEERQNDPLVLASDPSYSSVDVYFRKAGMGKKEKASVMAIHSILSSQHLLLSGSKSTTRLTTPSMAVHLLQALPPTLLPNHKWRASALVKSLASTLRQAVGDDSSTPKCKPDQWTILHTHLRLLDLYLLGQWSYPISELDEDAGEEREDWEATVDLLMLLGEASVWDPTPFDEDDQGGGSGGSDDEDETDEKSSKPSSHPDGSTVVDLCLEALLRVVVTLTHGDTRWARRVVYTEGGDTPGPALSWLTTLVKDSGEKVKLPPGKEPLPSPKRQKRRAPNQGLGDGAGTEVEDPDEVVSEGVQHRMRQKRLEERARALDRLCLALALLTNLVQAVKGVVNLFRESGTLLALVGVYEQQGKEGSIQEMGGLNEEEAAEVQQAQADASFLRGHLAVLFGLLMKENEENVDTMVELLPHRGESTKIKLNRLVDQARRFVSFFDVVQASQHHGDGGLNEDEQNEKKVAQEVVDFLEQLRDGVEGG